MAVLRSCAVFLAFLFITDARGDAHTSGLSNRIVVTSRVGCEIVPSRQPCPATLLNSDLAVEYETDAEMVNITIDDLKAEYNLGDDCAQTLTKIYCSKITPRCYENGTKYFENVTESCSKVDTICPKDSVEEGLCKDLKIGWQPLDACVMPTARINGSCPQPKSKMPQNLLNVYARSSVEYENIEFFHDLVKARLDNGSKMFTAKCIAKIQELYCMPFYCSADETELVAEYSVDNCSDIIDDCFPVIDDIRNKTLREIVLNLLDKYNGNCGLYPDDPDSVDGSGTTSTSTTPKVDAITSLGKLNATSTPNGTSDSTLSPHVESSTRLVKTAHLDTDSDSSPSDEPEVSSEKPTSPFDGTVEVFMTSTTTAGCGNLETRSILLASVVFLVTLHFLFH